MNSSKLFFMIISYPSKISAETFKALKRMNHSTNAILFTLFSALRILCDICRQIWWWKIVSLYQTWNLIHKQLLLIFITVNSFLFQMKTKSFICVQRHKRDPWEEWRTQDISFDVSRQSRWDTNCKSSFKDFQKF